MAQIRFKRLFVNPLDEIIHNINESMKLYPSETHTTEEISNIIFDKLISNDVSARIISYKFNNETLFSVQYYNSGRWVNFDYKGLDIKFYPIYSFTLNPTNIVKEEIVHD